SNLIKPLPVPSTSTAAQKSLTAGINGFLTNIARCCKPLPGDANVGYITRNEGLRIHRNDCGNILNARKHNEQRLIEIAWNEQTPTAYPVDLQIHVYDRAGLLRDISTFLANEKLNVLGLQTVPLRHSAEIYI